MTYALGMQTMWVLLLTVGVMLAADPKPDPKELPRIPHTPVAKARGTFEVKPGFDLQLAAAEPVVADPIAMSFDAHGRLYVVEMIGYSERRDADAGRIRRLEDADGDGRFEKSTVFAQGLAWPTAVICYNGGVFVGVTPKILFLKDTTGDGKADVNRTVLEGFGTGRSRLNVQAMFNSFRWGLDNRIHGCTSYMGGSVKDAAGKTVALNGRNFSFDPRTLELRAEDSTAQHGMSFDDYGRKFTCSNSSHLQALMYPSRYAGRNRYYALPSQRVSIATDGAAAEVFRLSPDEPWRIVRTRWRIAGQVRGPVEGGGRVSGYFTAATGVTIYRGDALGKGFRGNAFIADAGSNLIHRKQVRYPGVQPVGERPADERQSEFIASRDNWFRPVQFANAPDGCLYVADMYRETIEHPWSIPESIKQHLDLNSGNDRGRIWRIAPKGFKAPKRDYPDPFNGPQLVKLLAHPNGWHRDTAARLIYEQQNRTLIPALEKLAADRAQPLGQIHALWALHGLGALKADHVLIALKNGTAVVRVQAMQLAENFVKDPRVVRAVFARVDHPDRVVLYQLALTASHFPASDEKSLALAMALGHARGDRWIEAAVINAFNGDEELGDLFVAIHGAPSITHAARVEFLKLIGRRNRPGEVAKALLVVVRQPPNKETIDWVNALGPKAGSLPALEKEALRWLLLPAKEKSDSVLFPALKLAWRRGFKEAGPAILRVAQERPTEPLRVAAVQAYATFTDPQVAGNLVKLWANATPGMRSEIEAALATRNDRVPELLKALESGAIKKDKFSPNTIAALRRQKDAARVARVNKLFGVPAKAKTRAQAVQDLLPALKLKGNAAAGKVLYTQRCALCHRAGKDGHALGPDLLSVKANGPEKLLVSIVDPNREVAANYVAYDVALRDGSTQTGLLGDETLTHVRIRLPLGKELLLPRTDVKGMRSGGKSIMPEGLEAGLTPQQMADLLAFITGL